MRKKLTYHFDPKKLAMRRGVIKSTMAQVAERAGLAVPNYARLEAGTTNPTLDTSMRVARALGCLVEDLIAE
jgi:transcriptional regulator with XRE-family HTH domain